MRDATRELYTQEVGRFCASLAHRSRAKTLAMRLYPETRCTLSLPNTAVLAGSSTFLRSGASFLLMHRLALANYD